MNARIPLLLVSLVMLLLGAAGDAAAQQQAAPAPAGSAATALSDDTNYIIGPADRLKISVWNQGDISGEYAVAGDGSFTFPLIGRVVANGLTLAGLEAALRRQLADGFVKNPQVTVAVLEYRSKRVFVMGALRAPGTYALTGSMSLIEALARAGSTTSDAADHVFVIHSASAQGPVLPGEDASAEVTRIDLRRLDDGQQSEDVMLADGDTIFVPRASTIYVYGEVRRPGAYQVPQDTTIRQALSLAGGASDFGAVNRVKILRMVDGKEREIPVKLHDVVQPGDTVVVPERFF
jgi:polysaccharide export outer membrane protein